MNCFPLNDDLQVKKNSSPPLSLYGQLLWREFFYTAATNNPRFDKMEGNPICVQIPWDKNPEALAKWAEGRTGFPWIDAIMTQLRQEGWIHHLARHAVACFLTRGDLWISWEEGMKVLFLLEFHDMPDEVSSSHSRIVITVWPKVNFKPWTVAKIKLVLVNQWRWSFTSWMPLFTGILKCQNRSAVLLHLRFLPKSWQIKMDYSSNWNVFPIILCEWLLFTSHVSFPANRKQHMN